MQALPVLVEEVGHGLSFGSNHCAAHRARPLTKGEPNVDTYSYDLSGRVAVVAGAARGDRPRDRAGSPLEALSAIKQLNVLSFHNARLDELA